MTLNIVGVLYLISGLWCALNVEVSAHYLGFGLSSDFAKSEFLSVYGGLQLGLAVSMLIGARVAHLRQGVLFMAMLVSCVLFATRVASIWVYSDSVLDRSIWFFLLLEGSIALALTVSYARLTRRAQ